MRDRLQTIAHRKGSVLYIGGFELPDKNAAAHRVLNNAKLFRTIGYDTVFVGVTREKEISKNIFETKVNIQGFICYSIPYPGNIKEWFTYITDITVYRNIIRLIEDIVAVVCYNFPAFAMNKMKLFCKKNSIFCLADITEWYGGKGRSLPLKIIKDVESYYRMHVVHKKLDGLIVISKYLEDYYKECYVVRIPPLTDLTEEKWENKYSKSADTLQICYAGNPGSKDKVSVLISAVAKIHRDLRIDIIGISRENYLKQHPEHNEILEDIRIVFHGCLPHTTTLEYVKKANYSCFFREKNRVTMAGFPTKFSEAVSSGTPVITNDSSDIADYIRYNKNGCIVSDLSAETIANEIEKIGCFMEVNRETFDYRQYEEVFEKWFSSLMIKRGKRNT